MKKFFILTMGRTGSTAVIDQLNKSQMIYAAQELFLVYDFKKQDYKKPAMSSQIWPFILWKEEVTPWRYLTKVFGDSKIIINKYLSAAEKFAEDKGVECFGFKVLSNNLKEWPLLHRVLNERDYKSIYLTRNMARQVISGMVAKKSGLYNTKNSVPQLPTIKINCDEFDKKVNYLSKQVEKEKKFLEENGFDYITVSYETFLHNRNKFFDNIFNFLGISSKIPEASDYSIIIKELHKTIENYEEVVKCAEKLGFPIE